jgi:hypothetical protein
MRLADLLSGAEQKGYTRNQRVGPFGFAEWSRAVKGGAARGITGRKRLEVSFE